MPERKEHKRSANKQYNIVLIPEDKSGTSKSFRVSTLGIIGGFIFLFIFTAGLVLVTLIYTPVGLVLRVPNPELEKRYLEELVHVQEKLNRVTADVLFMREYNYQLRRALGEELSPRDTAGLNMSQLAIGAPRETDRILGEQITEPGIPELVEIDESLFPPGVMGLTTGPVRVSDVNGIMFRPMLPIMLPADGYVTRGFDAGQRHFGIDIAGKVNTPVVAIADGTVLFANWTYEDGFMVILSHGGGYFSVYKHNQSNLVRPGAVVRRGETIALLGNTGAHSYGPHLHFELWKDGVPLNPSHYFFSTGS